MQEYCRGYHDDVVFTTTNNSGNNIPAANFPAKTPLRIGEKLQIKNDRERLRKSGILEKIGSVKLPDLREIQHSSIPIFQHSLLFPQNGFLLQDSFVTGS